MVGVSLSWQTGESNCAQARNTNSFEFSVSNGTPSLFGAAVGLELWEAGYGRRRERSHRR